MEKVMICDHCLNRDGDTCLNCKKQELVAGRDRAILRLKETGKIKDSAKLRNIVKASEIVLFKDLCRVLEIPPSIANMVTTSELGQNALEMHLPKNELKRQLSQFLNFDQLNKLDKAFENIDYVYDCAGTVYGSSIHASGTLLSEDKIEMSIDSHTGDCHINGHYAEEYGYIKYDMLSLGTLMPISLIDGVKIDWDAFSDDRELMKYIHDNDLDFVFQFGSPIVSDMIQGVPEENINTITLSEVTSINRPGCLSINMNNTWKNIQNKVSPVEYNFNKALQDLRDEGILKI